MGFDFWVDYDSKLGNEFVISISTNYFDLTTPLLRRALELESVLNAEGTFVSLTTSVGELGYWRIPITSSDEISISSSHDSREEL